MREENGRKKVKNLAVKKQEWQESRTKGIHKDERLRGDERKIK